jgi:hypothetical protein
MHINSKQINLTHGNPYSAAAEKVTQRTSNSVRRKLKKSADDLDRTAGPDGTFIVGKWMSFQRSQARKDLEYQTSASGTDPDLG